VDSLKQRQQQMMAWLRTQEDDITAHICQQGEISVQQRLEIYHNAYRVRLRETLDTDLPVLGTYLGDDLYRQMVSGFIDASPSQFRSLRHFADPLPQYLATTEPFSDYPQIAELARFERLLLDAFDAPDAGHCDLQTFQQRPAEQWPELSLRFHPGLQLFNSKWNVVEIWQALKSEQQPPALQRQWNHWMLWRSRERLTEFSSLQAPEGVLIQAFLRGENLSQAAEQLLELIPEQEAGAFLFATLQQWLEKGLVSRLI